MFLGKERRVKPSTCTGCGQRLNGAMPIDSDNLPNEGDVTICLNCGHLMKFGKRGKLVNLTDAEYADVTAQPEIQKALEVVGQLKPRQ